MTQTSIAIRPAFEHDADAISELLGELGYPLEAGDVSRNIVFLSGVNDIVLVAQLGSTIAGVLSFHVMPMFHVVGNLGRITALVVSKHYQGRGIGRRLVEVAEGFATSRGCLKIEVTSGDRRAGAHEFYRKMGYEVDERRLIKRMQVG